MSGSDAAAPIPAPATGDPLADLVTCGICMELFYHPVTLDCLHTFCGDEILKWLREHGKCPTCRNRIKRLKDGYPSQALVDYYVQLSPDKARVLTAQERQAKDALYMPGNNLADELQGNRMDEDDDSVDDEYDGEDYEQWPPHRANPNIVYQPCAFCDPENMLGFVCPEPCPADFRPVSLYRSPPDPAVQKHTVCRNCTRLIPVRQSDEPCGSCEQRICPAGSGCNGDGSSDFFLDEYRSLGITEHERRTMVVADDAETILLRLVVNLCTGPNPPSTLGWVELDFLRAYIQSHTILPYDVLDDILDRHCDQDDPFKCTNEDRIEKKFCRECFYAWFTAQLPSWWCSRRDEVVDELPDDDRRRPKCWYGHECRTRGHNYSHAERYSHACWPVPPGQRTDNSAAARGDGAAAAV